MRQETDTEYCQKFIDSCHSREYDFAETSLKQTLEQQTKVNCVSQWQSCASYETRRH